MCHRGPLLLVVCLCLLSSTPLVAVETAGIVPLRDGGRAPLSAVAQFVSGPWASPHSISACPLLRNRKRPKVAIYTRDVTPGVIKLAQAIDEIVAQRPELKWSFLFVSHENDPRPTEDAFAAQLTKVEKLASDNRITHLSMGVLQRGPEPGDVVRRKVRLGFLAKDQTVIALIYQPVDPKKRSLVMTGVQYVSSEELTAESVSEITAKLKNTLTKESGKFKRAP